MARYAVIEHKVWKHNETGRRASIYGACPYWNEIEAHDWSIVQDGYTILDTATNTTGFGQKPFSNKLDATIRAQALNDAWDKKQVR